MVSTRVVTVIVIADVLLATAMIIAYIALMSNQLPELQLMKGSKKKHVIVYIYVAVCTLIQLLFAFQFYRVLTEQSEEEEDVEDQLRMSKYWLLASYFLLINWIVKAGIYSQQCDKCTISIALVIYLIEIIFRIFAICTINPFITQLEKVQELRERHLKLMSLSRSGRKFRENSSYQHEDPNEFKLQN